MDVTSSKRVEMHDQRRVRLVLAIGAGVAFCLLHALCVKTFTGSAIPYSELLYSVAAALALVVCARVALRSRPTLRPFPLLVCAGLLFWVAGSVYDFVYVEILHQSASISTLGDFLFILYGVPILVATSVTRSEQRSKLILPLYALQAAVLGALTYVYIYSDVIFPSGTRSLPPTRTLIVSFLVINVTLAILGTARYIASSEPDERRFFRSMLVYLWTYVLMNTINNVLVGDTAAITYVDVLDDIPFMVLCILLVDITPRLMAPEKARQNSRLTLYVATASPVFTAFAIFVLGIVVALRHAVVGLSSITIAAICYGIEVTALQVRNTVLQRDLGNAVKQLRALSMTDGLTGIPNRRRFDQALEQEWARLRRGDVQLSLVIVDVDSFKGLNDRYGHVYGDQCLVRIARALQAALPRGTDFVARYGGEEFAAILPDTDAGGAMTVAHAMHRAILELRIEHAGRPGGFVTASLGVATFASARGSAEDLVREADAALYLAKSEGRDQVRTSSADQSGM
jgi:diguanylate cyclase (GGDEF)-like protein